MTERRAPDLLYGHLGEASYDVDEQSWYFSRGINLESDIQPLQHMQECIPPSLRLPPDSTKTASKVLQSQEIWLQKALPEAGPARTTIASIARAHSPVSFTQHPSTLMAIGKASDIDQTSGRRKIQVMAMVHGEAGNLLRLIKPRTETLKWDSHDNTKLRSLNPTASEDCYWSGGGGVIQQITFGADSDGSTSWLAVLKAESITILRPIYRQVQTPSTLSVDLGTRFPPSRLSPNPILSLGNESIGGRSYVDASFNPWYIRQFAVVDHHGYWSVWNIEGQKRKRTTFEAKSGKSGHIQDNLSSGHGFKTHDSADGWGQILWAGGVSTLIMCNRRNLAVFDLKAAPKRLNSPEVVHPRSIDWILDMKRSPVNLNHVFVLTTRHIFWLQISEASEGQDEQLGYGGAKILLSCQHLRGQEDETAKLDLSGENEGCTVLLYSAQSPVVNTYRFSMALEESARPICSQGSFIIEFSNEDQIERPSGMIQTLCLLSTTFMLHNLKPISGPAKGYVDHNVRFYQLFGLSETLGLYHALCATRRIAPGESNAELAKYQTVLAPTIRRRGKFKSFLRVVEDQFIVSDGLEEDDDTLELFSDRHYALLKSAPFTRRQYELRDNLSFSIDAHRLFKASFLEREHSKPKGDTSPERFQNMAEYSKFVQSYIEQRKEGGLQGLTTLLDLNGNISYSEDVDEAASTLRELMDALSSDTGAPSTMTVIPLGIRPSLFVQSDLDLSDIYDKLVDLWVSCLPRRTPGPARLAKEKLVRIIATELCLSSLGVLIRDKSVILPKLPELQGTDFMLSVRTKPDSSEAADFQSIRSSSDAQMSSLPTPAATPSLPSNDSTASFREPAEDGAISRLRAYTLSIKSQPPLGTSRSTILAHWPSVPGADPSKYSWEASRKAVVEDEDVNSDEEEALIRQQEQDRRRRRTERFLKRQRVNTIDAASQPLPALAVGSQPGPTQHPISSQSADVPMTQPDRGAFGSRLGPKGFKKRRTMGF